MGTDADGEAFPATPKKHMTCPFCGSYDVERLYVGSRAVDCCACVACGAEWEESAVTGAYRGRVSSASVAIPGD